MNRNKAADIFLDSALRPGAGSGMFQKMACKIKNAQGPVLFSGGRRTERFFTEDSNIYINPQKPGSSGLGSGCDFLPRRFDGLGARFANNYMKYRPHHKNSDLVEFYARRADWIKENIGEIRLWNVSFWRSFSLARAWNMSLVGAVIVGMVSMSFIYRYLGPGASADSKPVVPAVSQEGSLMPEKDYPQSKVLGAEDEKERIKNGIYFESVLNDLIESQKSEFEEKIRTMVAGYPIEEMAPYIAQQDPVVAAFLISIARKESSWGTRVPVLNGQDCYNYWGYRGMRKLMGTGGHTCFNSRKDAVDTVAKRISFLVGNKKLDTPAKMVIWKCGSDCNATGGQAAAQKWISDVDHYFKKFNNM